MKRKLLISFIISFITVLGLNVSAQADTTTTQVTSNSYEDSMPRIKGDYLVWQEHVNGHWQVFLYNIENEETTPITNNNYDSISPQTDGEYVVWFGACNQGGEVFQYNIATGETTKITNDSNVDLPPQIADGRVVWASHEVTDSVEPGEIKLYDIVTGQKLQLTDNDLDDFSPKINSESVIWIQIDEADNSVLFIYDISQGTTQEAPEDFIWEDSPQTDGDLTVSMWNDGSDWEIIVRKDGQNGFEQVTNNTLDDRYPSISGNYITWIAGEGNEAEIYLALFSSESSDPGGDVLPIPPLEMSLVRVDSEEIYGEDGRGENAIDGAPSSIWHTEWYRANPAHPHEIVIDLGYDRQVCGFSYLPRQDGSYNGGIAAYEFYVSTDDQNWGNPVATGVFPRTSDKQEVAFDARLARYVRLVALSEVAGYAWTSAAEIEVMEQIGGYVNEAPEAVIEADPTSGFAPMTVTFNAGGSSDSDGDIVEYRWDFGDGGSGTGVTISHDFMTSGTYTVTLTVVDNEGATAQAQVAITVNNTLVGVAGIPYWEMSLVRVDSEEIYGEDGRGENAIDGAPSSFWHTEWYRANPVHPHEIVIDLGHDRQVCGFSYLPRQDGSYNGGIAAYEFYVSTDDQNWGNPVATGVFPATSDKQEVAFDARHARYVRLVALSEVAGYAWTSAAEIEVMEQIGGYVNETPEAVIEADLTSGFAPMTVTFNAGGSSDSDGDIVEYRWDFGDGGSGTGVTISHDFMTSGTYTVTLTVVDNEGATAQAQVAITVNDTLVGVAGIPYWEMSLVRVDSEEIYGEDGRGENAIDGASSFWHTEWYYSDPAHPHEIVIDLGHDRQVCGFSYLPRQDGSYNGGIAAYEFYVSTDDQNWGNPVATGVFPRTIDKQEVAFDARLARYVRLVALSEVAGHAWTSAAEIEVMELR